VLQKLRNIGQFRHGAGSDIGALGAGQSENCFRLSANSGMGI
jgi:hypothetical protein